MTKRALATPTLLILLLPLMFWMGCDNKPQEPIVRIGDVQGAVHNIDGTCVIPGAIVSINSDSVVASNDGLYFLEGIPEGYNIIKASKGGYFKYSIAITVKSHTDHDIFLEAEPKVGTISGHVYLDQTHVPIEGVTVSCLGIITKTDSNGYYVIDSIPLGTHFIAALKSQWIFTQKEIVVDELVEVDIQMPSARLTGQVISRLDGPIAGAKVEVGVFSGTTGDGGEFDIPAVPQGTHTIVVSHPEYNTMQFVLSIDRIPDIQKVTITQVIYDTIGVSNDANISISFLEGCSNCPSWTDFVAGDNYDQKLRLEYFMDTQTDYTASTRFLLQLPALQEHLQFEIIKRARLYLVPTKEAVDPGVVSTRRALRDATNWSESTVNWQTTPQISNLLHDFFEVNLAEPVGIDVTSIYRSYSEDSRTLRFQKEEIGITPEKEFIYFWSSEAPDPANRPFVVIEYDY